MAATPAGVQVIVDKVKKFHCSQMEGDVRYPVRIYADHIPLALYWLSLQPATTICGDSREIRSVHIKELVPHLQEFADPIRCRLWRLDRRCQSKVN